MTIALSILDHLPVISGKTVTQALHDTVELAPRRRPARLPQVWVAEHHNSAAFAGSAKAVLAAALLQGTNTCESAPWGPPAPPRSGARPRDVPRSRRPASRAGGLGSDGPAGRPTPFPTSWPCCVRTGPATWDRSADTGRDVWLFGTGTAAGDIAGRQRPGYCFGHFLTPT